MHGCSVRPAAAFLSYWGNETSYVNWRRNKQSDTNCDFHHSVCAWQKGCGRPADRGYLTGCGIHPDWVMDEAVCLDLENFPCNTEGCQWLPAGFVRHRFGMQHLHGGKDTDVVSQGSWVALHTFTALTSCSRHSSHTPTCPHSDSVDFRICDDVRFVPSEKMSKCNITYASAAGEV